VFETGGQETSPRAKRRKRESKGTKEKEAPPVAAEIVEPGTAPRQVSGPLRLTDDGRRSFRPFYTGCAANTAQQTILRVCRRENSMRTVGERGFLGIMKLKVIDRILRGFC
jgi:hypothetical protein